MITSMYSTRVTQLVRAPRSAVYRALMHADAIAKWRVPDNMRSEVHEFDPREGGYFQVTGQSEPFPPENLAWQLGWTLEALCRSGEI